MILTLSSLSLSLSRFRSGGGSGSAARVNRGTVKIANANEEVRLGKTNIYFAVI